MRIGFLFSHYVRHQVLHAVPIASELSRRYPKGLDQNLRLRQTCSHRPAKLSVLYPGERCERVLTHVPACVAMVDPLVKGFKFLRKKAVL